MAAVDKIQTFCSVFVYFGGPRGPVLEAAVGKIQAFRSFFVYFGGCAGPF